MVITTHSGNYYQGRRLSNDELLEHHLLKGTERFAELFRNTQRLIWTKEIKHINDGVFFFKIANTQLMESHEFTVYNIKNQQGCYLTYHHSKGTLKWTII